MMTHYNGRVAVSFAVEANYVEKMYDDGSYETFLDSYTVLAQTPEGQRWWIDRPFTSKEEALDFIDYHEVIGGLINLDAVDENGFRIWIEAPYVYGSELYQQSGQEAMMLEAAPW